MITNPAKTQGKRAGVVALAINPKIGGNVVEAVYAIAI